VPVDSIYAQQGTLNVIDRREIPPEEYFEKMAVHIAKALQQARSVSDSEHYDHHVWIKGQVERDQARRVFWDQLHTHVVKWGVVSVLTFLGFALWLGIKSWMKGSIS